MFDLPFNVTELKCKKSKLRLRHKKAGTGPVTQTRSINSASVWQASLTFID